MGKMAKYGIFSPAVDFAKKLLGEKQLNKLRGQGITLHSQVSLLTAPMIVLPMFFNKQFSLPKQPPLS